MGALLHNWDNLLVYAFPPWALASQVLLSPDDPGGSVLATASVVPRPSGSLSSRGLQAVTSCVETLQRFARAGGSPFV